MGVLEELLKEIKLLNKNLSAIRVEMSTVDTSTIQNVVKEAPSEKPQTEELKEEPKEEPQQESDTTFSKDYVLNLGKEFLKNGDQSDKAAFKEKLSELGANKLSTVAEKDFPEIVDFMKARLSA
ncbi:hypothetical protein MT340_009195 [Staphylococcus sp. NRL 16/872]|uniref:hypothetical protein n=1 Tax=Staphylococcus sp. NRL 16/872 TaxID=2930131 RepID=UPI001FB2CD54|nr:MULTISPECIES: hypothetical protein [unclassified Staphylococcus]MCJ1656715.1 hypothetical protein [Staphylococcus sp. NRL 21/187]MCJ1668563.1 hypothetical protein [Staphylococcus sp. NRL 19/737]WEN68780.1 hypothetical protein MT340_009195 [Staphylococcus sp. NRL 16/872]